MKSIIKHNYKIIVGILIGILLSITTVYAVDAYIESNKVTYTNHNKKNVEEAIDELYERSGIHKEKWVDPELNGADPVLNDSLIPVEITDDGEVYYANENSEWYNYKKKKWANAVILVDNPSNEDYGIGDHILESDIESYFVWIPRYQYKVWDLGNYTEIYTRDKLTEDVNNPDIDTAFWKVAGSNSKLIDIKFGVPKDIPKMTEPNATGVYYTHPAFTLGNKDLNGIWVGKFETGYNGTISTESSQLNSEEPDSVIIKPNVTSWRYINVKNIFMTSYNYERKLDSHMMKNTEWGAVAYLSHSVYGIGSNININNNSEWRTGYSATASTDQRTYKGDTGTTDEKDKTQPWNSVTGYLASTTGNISGIYDISGGAWEYVAAYRQNSKDADKSGFTEAEITAQIAGGYIDEYITDNSSTAFNKRILGDAAGEMGPFYRYNEGDGSSYAHSSWYASYTTFVTSAVPWFARGGGANCGAFAGAFYVIRNTGDIVDSTSFRIALAPTN